MNLGNLAFTDDEAFQAIQRSAELVIPGEIDTAAALGLVLNRILKEKLEKAQIISGRLYGKHVFEPACMHTKLPDSGPSTHRCRVVCIELDKWFKSLDGKPLHNPENI